MVSMFIKFIQYQQRKMYWQSIYITKLDQNRISLEIILACKEFWQNKVGVSFKNRPPSQFFGQHLLCLNSSSSNIPFCIKKFGHNSSLEIFLFVFNNSSSPNASLKELSMLNYQHRTILYLQRVEALVDEFECELQNSSRLVI